MRYSTVAASRALSLTHRLVGWLAIWARLALDTNHGVLVAASDLSDADLWIAASQQLVESAACIQIVLSKALKLPGSGIV